MAHSTPTAGPGPGPPGPGDPPGPGGPTGPAGPGGHRRLHAAGPWRGRRAGTAAVAMPLLLGVLYGLWAAEIQRSTPRPGPISTGNVVFGVVSGIIVAVLAFLLHRLPRRVRPELRAGAWAAFSGGVFGYLYVLTDAPVFRTVVIGLLTAAGFFLITFYRYRTAEVAPDTAVHHRAGRRRSDPRVRT